MKGWFTRWREVETRGACKCGKEFVVIRSSLLGKFLPWEESVLFCPFCGEALDWNAINEAQKIPIKDVVD